MYLVLGIGLGVLEEVQQELGGLERPAALCCPVNLGLENKKERLCFFASKHMTILKTFL